MSPATSSGRPRATLVSAPAPTPPSAPPSPPRWRTRVAVAAGAGGPSGRAWSPPRSGLLLDALVDVEDHALARLEGRRALLGEEVVRVAHRQGVPFELVDAAQAEVGLDAVQHPRALRGVDDQLPRWEGLAVRELGVLPALDAVGVGPRLDLLRRPALVGAADEAPGALQPPQLLLDRVRPRFGLGYGRIAGRQAGQHGHDAQAPPS